MRTNKAAIDLIKHFEGCSLKPYRCPTGVLTVGWGHALREKDADKYIAGILQSEADALLNIDIMKAESGVNSLIRAPLTENQFGALVSFVFNLGSGRLQASTLRNMINRGETSAAADQFGKWIFAGGKKLPGLIARREAERILFMTPDTITQSPQSKIFKWWSA